MIKMKEQNQFMWHGSAAQTGQEHNLIDALNNSEFRGSLKKAYGGKSMALTYKNKVYGRNVASDDTLDSDSDQGFSPEELKVVEEYMH